MTQAVIDAAGKYIISIADGAAMPAGMPGGAAIVATAPDDARQVWNFGTGAWGAAPPPLTPAQVAQALLADSSATSIVLRGLVALLAQRFGLTAAQVVTAIVNAAN